MNARIVVGAAIAVAVPAFTALVVAGTLAPPVGPVSPTMKTLSEVEPRIPVGPTTTPGDATGLFVISAPGSYYLTGNVTGVAGKSGIVIATSDVILDLNGFAVIGTPGAVSGVRSSVISSSIAVRNGSVSAWPLHGVTLGGFNVVVEDVIARDCGSTGISVFGDASARVERCEAYRCGVTDGDIGGGISVPEGSIVNCTALECFGFGLEGMIIRRSVATWTFPDAGAGQMGTGIFAAGIAGLALVESCVAHSNADIGINSFGLVRGCYSSANFLLDYDGGPILVDSF